MKYKDFKETFDYLTASEIDLWSDNGDEIDNLPEEELDNMEVVRFHRHGCILYVTLKQFK